MDKGPCQIIFSCSLFKFLLRTSIRTPEAENPQKNKHIQPQPKFRCSNKKKRVLWRIPYKGKEPNADKKKMRSLIIHIHFSVSSFFRNLMTSSLIYDEMIVVNSIVMK